MSNYSFSSFESSPLGAEEFNFVLFELVCNSSDKPERKNIKQKLEEMLKNQNQTNKTIKINDSSKGIQMINDNTLNVFNFNSLNLNLETKK